MSIKVVARDSVSIEVDATGGLRILADASKYHFQLPPYTDRGDVRARWVDGGIQVDISAVDNPTEDVFIVPIE